MGNLEKCHCIFLLSQNNPEFSWLTENFELQGVILEPKMPVLRQKLYQEILVTALKKKMIFEGGI